MDNRLLEVKDLRINFHTEEGTVPAINEVSLHINKGETLRLVGESGSGKSVTSLFVMRLIPTPPGQIAAGKIVFQGENLVELSESEMQKIRGNKISRIFQEPMTSLNPLLTCGEQISESIQIHQGFRKSD